MSAARQERVGTSKTIALLAVASMTLTLGFGVAPALAADSGPLSSSSAAVSGHSGEDLVKAIYFGVGDAVELIQGEPGFEYIDELQKNQTPEAVATVELLVQEIDGRNPGLLKSAGKLLVSGDPYKVQAASEKINTAMGEVLNELADEAANDPSEVEPLALVAVLGPVFHVAAAVTGAVVAGFAVLVVGVVWVIPSNSAPGEQQEQLIADMTEALSS